MMNYLNELGDKDSGMMACLVVSTPWDCTQSTASLEQPLNWLLFNRRLTNNLIKMVKRLVNDDNNSDNVDGNDSRSSGNDDDDDGCSNRLTYSLVKEV